MKIIKINLDKINRDLCFKGAKGTYLDIVLFDNDGGADQYGNTHVALQSLSKEQREQGIRAPIIGNAKFTDGQGGRTARQPPGNPMPPAAESGSDDVPF